MTSHRREGITARLSSDSLTLTDKLWSMCFGGLMGLAGLSALMLILRGFGLI